MCYTSTVAMVCAGAIAYAAKQGVREKSGGFRPVEKRVILTSMTRNASFSCSRLAREVLSHGDGAEA